MHTFTNIYAANVNYTVDKRDRLEVNTKKKSKKHIEANYVNVII